MASLTKKQMRSLPTLTEVVDTSLAKPTDPLLQPGAPEIEVIVERVMQRLDLSLPGYIREVVEALVLTHIQEVEPRLKQKVSIAVRQAVAKTVVAVIKDQPNGPANR
jgi:hypothetical protein